MRTLPPGAMGLPLIGETVAFVRNPYAFLEERGRRHGNVFKSQVLGKKVVFLSGLEGAEAFYDPENISREDAHPSLILDMFGGVNFEMYDGPRHFALKSIALQAFDREAIAGYLPDMQRLIEATLARLAERGEFSAMRALRPLAIEAICWNIMGLAPGAETASLTREYGTLLAGLSSLPVRIPGTRYARSMAARDRVLGKLSEVIGERRARPGTDGLSRILTARAADGGAYTDREALLEAHHIVVAGFVVYALMAEVFRRLAEVPELHDRCAAEIAEAVGDGELTVDALESVTTCANVVREAKRVAPLVPLAFGRARRPFTSSGFSIPQGWRVYLALHLNNRDPAVYEDPHRFNPDRFGPGRDEHRRHPMAFIPQGAEPPTGHRCLGLDYSSFLVLAFLAVLVQNFEWKLPPQDLAYDWKRRPPEPRDGVRVQMWRK